MNHSTTKEKMLLNKKMKEQFKGHHESMNHKTSTYPDYEQYGVKQVKRPKPDLVEFGKAFDISSLNVIANDLEIKAAYDMVLSDYFRAKAENFPTWEGLPTIKVQQPTDALRRFYQVGWYVQVPKPFVINPEDKLEEDLWNS